MAPVIFSKPTVVLLSLLASALGEFQDASADQCNCYQTNGSSPSYFTDHKFFDFRSLKQYAGVPKVIEDSYKSSYVPAPSEYFRSKDFSGFWSVQGWNNSATVHAGDASVTNVYSPNNIYIQSNSDPSPPSDTFLTLRTLRLDEFQSSAEFQTVGREYQFLSARMMARTVGHPGAVTAMFTYRESNPVQEADLEFRTEDPEQKVQYTNQPSFDKSGQVIKDATKNVTLPDGLTIRDWAVHRVDWTPGDSTWYVNDKETAKISFQVPKDPGMIMLNSWSDGGSWSGNMTKGQDAYLQVQWIELLYNVSDSNPTHKRDGGQCQTVCSIDEASKVGTPVVLPASGAVGTLGHAGALAALLPVLAMAAMMF